MNALSENREDGSLWTPIHVAWLVTLLGTLGSLFFSEVMKLPPCVLCWYQRLGLYPLVPILTVGILARDTKVPRYAWSFAGFGLLTALYHCLLYYHVIPETISPCTAGSSCTERQIEWLGFISIPLLSLIAFLFLALCLFLFRRQLKRIPI